MANAQAEAPLIFILSYASIPLPTGVVIFNPSGLVKPQMLTLNRSARGTVFNTASAAFLNDFGEGVPMLQISGNTGFGSEYGSGFISFKTLEGLFIQYLQLRQSSTDPSLVTLTFIDTMNAEAFNCYPMKFTLNRNARSPHLYFYEISLVLLSDLLENAAISLTSLITSGTLGTVLQSVLGGVQSIENEFSQITSIL